MTKFSGSSSFTPAFVPANTLTHEGGDGWKRTPRQELFLQAVTEMAEDTFYETQEQRRTRLAQNVAQVVSERDGWQWVASFARWLRHEANMRSASVMVACEAVAAGRPANATGPTARQLVDSVCVRADEPAEVLGYWLQFHGRQVPAGVKRGVADAAARLYNERNALKYDGQSRAIRMADVVELVHPSPSSDQQSALFRYLLDHRHDRDGYDLRLLPAIYKDRQLLGLPENERLAAFQQGLTTEAGWSWERVAGWLPGGLTAEVWERVIPSMGYMALLRNLRNFDQAGISSATRKAVAERLADPEQVAASRQFPYRFLSAWKATESLEWGPALETALGHSVKNVPEFAGRTLVLIDTSGSMQSPVGGARSQAMRWEVAGLFGAVVAARSKNVDLAIYATGVEPVKAPTSSTSILRFCEQLRRSIGSVGHGTNTWEAIRTQYDGHDRVVVLTDEQSHDFGRNPGTWLHFVNLAGYAPSTAPPDRRTFASGGFNDSLFKLIPLSEHGASGRWPWES